MNALDSSRQEAVQNLSWLYKTRLFTAGSAFCVYAVTAWFGGFLPDIRPLLALVLFEIIVNRPYSFILKRGALIIPFTTFTLIIDVIVITIALHWVGTFDALFYSALYLVTISVTGVILSKRASLMMATLSSFAYAALILLESTGFVPRQATIGLHLNEMQQVSLVAGHVVFFYIIAYSSGQWIDRIKRIANQRQDLLRRLMIEEGRLREAYQKVEALSITDELTGLVTRPHLIFRIKQEFDRSTRYGRVFSCLVIDLDFFKNVNERYGSAFGDRVLRGIGKLLKSSVRVVDVVGRYGGDEFLILLPETSADRAKIFAERLREKIAQESFGIDGVKSPVSFKASLGIVEFPDKNVTTVAACLESLDEALYTAKKEGRNRVIIYKKNVS